MNTRKIGIFCEAWESGGIESFITNILSHMDLSGLEVEIITACLKESVFTSSLQAMGVHFVELSGNQRNLLKNYQLFRTLLQERKYDVIHFNLFQGLSLYYVQLAKQADIPIRIAHSHGTGLRNSKTKALKLMLHAIGKRLWTSSATDHWACSGNAAKFLFSDRITANGLFQPIPNAIETQRFRFCPEIRGKIRSEMGLDDQFLIGMVGRLSQEKNPEFLLDVFAEVSKLHPESFLLYVGSGDQEGLLKEKAAKLGIAARTKFCGTVREVEQIMWALDVLAFPSHIEGFGLVALEAQAAGLPVICSENIPDETHVTPLIQTVELSRGATDWAKALIRAKTDTPRSDYAQSIRDAGYDISTIAQRIRNKYLES